MSDSRLAPWLAGLVVAAALCSSYLLISVFRATWQSRYPVLAQQWANDGPFTVLGLFGTEGQADEISYAARAQNSAHHLPAYDPYIRESLSRRILVIDGLTYAVLGAVQALTRDINATWLMVRFLCCILWVVLLYRLARRVDLPPGLALCFAVIVTCFSDVWSGDFVAGLSWQGGWVQALLHNAWRVLNYGRTTLLRLPRPLLTYAFLFAAALAVIAAAQKEDWRWSALSGALGGALAYVRLDVWSSYLLASCAFALVCSAQRRKPVWPLILSAALTIALSLPFLYFNYPPDPDLVRRGGAVFGRRFDLASVPYALVFILVLRCKRQAADLFCACMAAATFVMLNSSLVLGYSLELSHWRNYANIFVSLSLLSFLPPRLAGRERLWQAAAALALFTSFLQGVGYAAVHFPFHGLPKDYAAALRWLDSHSDRDEVVFTLNPEVNLLIPAFTHDKTFLAFTEPVASDYPPLQNCRRLAAGLRLLEADAPRFLRDCLPRKTHLDWHDLMNTGLRRGEIEKDYVSMLVVYRLPTAEIPAMVEAALKDPSELQPDLLWVGPFEREYAGRKFLANHPGWAEVYSNPSVTLYRREPVAPLLSLPRSP